MIDLLTLTVVSVVGYKVWQGMKAVDRTVDKATGAAADAYVELMNPIVGAQIKIKSQYFQDFKLVPAAKDVLKQYEKLYSAVFLEDGTIKGEYIHIIDNGVFYSDSNLPIPN